jgi:hypothetical protein
MRRNGIKICSVMLVMLFVFTGTSYALDPSTSDHSGVTTSLMENHNPNPPVITGPAAGKVGKIYGYNFYITDPDGDDLIKILIEWGGSEINNYTYICWLCSGGSKPNGTIFVADHSWSTAGSFTIRAKVWDTQDNESDWGTFSVSMPFSYNIPVLSFWERLLERFPHAFPILRYLMGY